MARTKKTRHSNVEVQKQVDKKEKVKADAKIAAKTAPTIELKKPIKLKRKGLLGRGTDFLAKAGVQSATEKQLLPGVLGGVEKKIESKIDPNLVKTDPIAKGLGLANLAVETIGGGAAFAPEKLATQGASSITQMKMAHSISPKTGNLMARGTKQTGRAIIGKSEHQIPEFINKLFIKNRAVASRFATNSKSIGLTKTSLLKRGLSAAGVTFVAGAFGTYPFTAWAQQEVLSGLKINARDAREAGDFELAEEMITLRKETQANPWWRDLPYKNVISQFEKFFEADKLAIKSEERLIAHARGELEFEGTSTGEDIAARDAERDKLFEEREDEQTEKFAKIKDENKKADIEEMTWKSEYYALIRDNKYDEAAQLLELQGGM